jgi:hypothetical protein
MGQCQEAILILVAVAVEVDEGAEWPHAPVLGRDGFLRTEPPEVLHTLVRGSEHSHSNITMATMRIAVRRSASLTGWVPR